MKKKLLLLFVLISTFGFSQESIFDIINYSGGKKIITATTACNYTNYLCSSFLDELTSDSSGGLLIKRGAISYYSSNGTTIAIFGGHTFTINSVIFSEINNNNSTYINSSGFDTIGGGLGSILTGTFNWSSVAWSGEENGANSTDNKAKTLWYEVDLPQSFIDNLVEGDEVKIYNRQADFSGGGFANGGDLLVLTKTAGELIVTSSNGYNQVLLSVPENENSKNKISIYPNPTYNFITIQNKENSSENFEYKIVDLTGRIVKSGNSKFNEQINIESLEIGNYIIQIETEKGEKLSKKLIKN